jgi:hypothetical protein
MSEEEIIRIKYDGNRVIVKRNPETLQVQNVVFGCGSVQENFPSEGQPPQKPTSFNYSFSVSSITNITGMPEGTTDLTASACYAFAGSVIDRDETSGYGTTAVADLITSHEGQCGLFIRVTAIGVFGADADGFGSGVIGPIPPESIFGTHTIPFQFCTYVYSYDEDGISVTDTYCSTWSSTLTIS